VLSASAIFMITMGVRQSLGLFISPLNTATGLGLVTVSFAIGLGLGSRSDQNTKRKFGRDRSTLSTTAT
jgi:hypothetical protein